MKQRLVLILAFTLIAKFSHSQIIDRYGVNIGSSYSSQIWDYKLLPVDSDNEYKFGFQAFIQAEKDFGNIFAFRTEFGYIQKGFKNNIELRFADGIVAEANRDNVILHDLALNLGVKVKPLKADYSPYLLVGFRSDYMISYKDIELTEPGLGLTFNMYEYLIEDFNKFNLGGLVGLGIDIKNLIYFEIEYNPNFTKSIDGTGLSVKDNCWGVKIGLNINKLTE
jgi:hypothetical protein